MDFWQWAFFCIKNPKEIFLWDFVFVRRIGVTKPPVQLGVGKNTLV